MPSEKSPGLKILWVWTLGTAASTLSFSYIIYSRSYTHTHTYLSFFFFCSTCYECGADKTEGHGDCHERTTTTTTTGTHFLWCASGGHGAGAWGCCARRNIIGFDQTPPLLFLFIYWNLRFCLCFIGIWRVWKSMRTMCLLNVLNENVKSHFGFVYLAMFSSLIIDYINM